MLDRINYQHQVLETLNLLLLCSYIRAGVEGVALWSKSYGQNGTVPNVINLGPSKSSNSYCYLVQKQLPRARRVDDVMVGKMRIEARPLFGELATPSLPAASSVLWSAGKQSCLKSVAVLRLEVCSPREVCVQAAIYVHLAYHQLRFQIESKTDCSFGKHFSSE